MKLPHAERADLGDKLEAYCLNIGHQEGRHKARVFQAALGITLENAEVLRRAVLDAAIHSDKAEPRGDNGYGKSFVLRFPMETAAGRAVVLAAWIILPDEDFPRLTTCYIV